MKWFHSHQWRLQGGDRLFLNRPMDTYFVNIWRCTCGEIKARATDMAPYLAMKSIHVGGTNEHSA